MLLIDIPITLEVHGKTVTMTPREAAKALWKALSEDEDSLGDVWLQSSERVFSFSPWTDSEHTFLDILREYHRRRDALRWRSIDVEVPEEGQWIEAHSQVGSCLATIAGKAATRDGVYIVASTKTETEWPVWLWRPASEPGKEGK